MADSKFATKISKDRNDNAVGNPIWIQHSDGTAAGILPGSGATNLGKAVDAAAGAADVGVALLAVRDDALTTLTPVDGDYVRLRTNNEGALWVALSGSSFPSKVDDSAFAIGSDAVSPMGALADETAPDSVDEGDVGIPRMTLDRKLLVRIVGATDANRLDINASGQAQVEVAVALPAGTNNIGDVDVVSQTPGTGATNLGKAVDAAGGAADVGVASLFIRDDVLTTLTPVDGDYVRGRTDSEGALWTHPKNSETAPLYVYQVNTVTSGSEFHDENETNVASDSTANHDYTVVNTTALLKSVDYGSSGMSKVEVWAGPIASLVRYATRFTPEMGGGGQIFFDPPVEVPVTGTGTIRIIVTNFEGIANSIYTTAMGNDV